jgi:hypothetical protein
VAAEPALDGHRFVPPLQKQIMSQRNADELFAMRLFANLQEVTRSQLGHLSAQ